jgi:hypothetical protein
MSFLKSFTVLFLGALLALFVGMNKSAVAQEVSDQDLMIRKAVLMAQRMGDVLKSEIRFPMQIVVVERQDESPFVAVVSKEKECLLVVNSKPSAWKNWQVFREAAGMNEMDSFRFAALHELGHCQNRLGRPDGEAVIPPGPQSELNSDLYAVRKVEQMYGVGRGRALAMQVIQGRKLYAGWSRTYDIADRLQTELQDLIALKVTASAL